MVAALMWINAAFAVPAYVGPISNHFPGLRGSDFSWAIGLVVGAVTYYLLARRGVQQEVEALAHPMNTR
jgi:predicted MFS family arabinose efflux permease